VFRVKSFSYRCSERIARLEAELAVALADFKRAEQDVGQLSPRVEELLADLAAAKEALAVLVGNEDIAYDYPREISNARDALARLDAHQGEKRVDSSLEV